jgi:hypothetical protein
MAQKVICPSACTLAQISTFRFKNKNENLKKVGNTAGDGYEQHSLRSSIRAPRHSNIVVITYLSSAWSGCPAQSPSDDPAPS